MQDLYCLECHVRNSLSLSEWLCPKSRTRRPSTSRVCVAVVDPLAPLLRNLHSQFPLWNAYKPPHSMGNTQEELENWVWSEDKKDKEILEMVGWKPWRGWRVWSISLMRPDCRSWGCLAWRRDTWEGFISAHANILKAHVKRSQILQWCPASRQGPMGTETLTLPSEYKENIFTLRVTEHWKQAVQWGCGVSLTRGIPNLPGCDPLQPSRGDPVRRSLQTPIVLWFCNNLRKWIVLILIGCSVQKNLHNSNIKN